MRLFVAADLPADARAACATWRDRAMRPALRPVPDDSLHVTLAFLGEAEDDAAAALPARLAPGARPARGLSLGAGRWLPSRRPRVLVLEVEDGRGELAALADGVARAVADRERRSWLAHVTVARVRTPLRPFVPPPRPGTSFAATALTLYRSHRGRGAARYEALWSLNLTELM